MAHIKTKSIPLLVPAFLLGMLFGCGGPSGTSNSSQSSGNSGTGGNGIGSTGVPQITLTIPVSVASGQSFLISWSTVDADSCIASGAWSGIKSTSGSETIDPLASTQTFNLGCTGPGGNNSKSGTVVLITSAGGSVSGQVDSSRINKLGVNAIYVFSGSVVPDDIDGDGIDPITVIPVVQDYGSCTWSYSSPSLMDGIYTIAFTSNAADDDSLLSDSLNFLGTTVVAIDNAGLLHDISAQSVIKVGPTRAFTSPSQALALASSGDVIEIDAGTYIDDIVTWRISNITLRGVNGRAHMLANSLIPYTSGNDVENGMGIWVTRGNNISVENIEFSGARVPDENGAGIRALGNDLTVCNGYFHDNENGILGGAYGTMIIEYSEFDNNGLGEVGRTHNIYISGGQTLIFRHNNSHHAYIGHNLKSRAVTNYVLYNRLMDEDNGQSSYALDIPDGGTSYVIGNILQQGLHTDNSNLVSYGAESLGSGRSHELYVVNNTLVNDRGAGTFLSIASGTSIVKLINNIFSGNGTVVSGPNQQQNNLVTNSAGFVNQAMYDYHLTAGSAARDGGINPGSANGVNLAPLYEYQDNASKENRPLNGALDIGAYEF